MEELGIGRPSTYASTLAVLRDRDYVKHRQEAPRPEDKGRLVTAFLESFFARYVEYDFTAGLEEKLDRVAEPASSTGRPVLRDFWTISTPPSTAPRICARPKCSTISTTCSARTSSRPRKTAPTRAPARPAAMASCR
jgi:hypothetical protein